MKLIRKLALLFVAIAFVLAVSSLAQISEKTEGAALFKKNCAMCHGADGAGNTTMGKMEHIVNLHSAPVQSMTEAELVAVIENGKGKMPAFKTKLKPEEIKDLAAYIKGMKSETSNPK
jgi:cytochrome c6